DVDGEDQWAVGNSCSHDGTQAHGAAAVNGNGAPELWLQAVQDSASTGLNAASQRAEQRSPNLFIDLHVVAFVINDMSSEGGVTEERGNVVTNFTHAVID